jgi:hypothetical protein
MSTKRAQHCPKCNKLRNHRTYTRQMTKSSYDTPGAPRSRASGDHSPTACIAQSCWPPGPLKQCRSADLIGCSVVGFLVAPQRGR